MKRVARQESGIFNRQLQDIKSGETPAERYLFHIGERGIGKTELLTALADECAQLEVPHALVHALTGNSEIPRDISDLLTDAARQIDIPVQESIGTGMPVAFAEAVGHFSRQKPAAPVALLFDDFDRLSLEEQTRLQVEVFAPLIPAENVIIATTVTDPVPIPRFDLRRVAKEVPLMPFTVAETAIQVGDEQLGRAVHAMTFGLPLANRLATEGATDPKIVSALLADKDDPSKPDEVAVAVSPLRRFGYGLLRDAAAHLQGKQPKDIKIPQVIKMVEDLSARGLIRWNPNLPSGFSLYPTIRQIAAGHLERTQPKAAKALYSLGLSHYQRLFSEERRPEWADAYSDAIGYYATALQKLA